LVRHLVLLRRATEKRVDAEGRLTDGVGVLIGRAEDVTWRRGGSSGRGRARFAATTRRQLLAEAFPAGVIRILKEAGSRVILGEAFAAGVLVVSDYSVLHVIR